MEEKLKYAKKAGFCSAEEASFGVKYLNSYRGDPLQVFCKNFEDNPQVCERFEEIPSYLEPTPSRQFYLLPLVDSLSKN